MFDDRPTHDEIIRQHVRDSAVASAMDTHKDALGDIDRRLVNEIAQLAVHNALIQYAAHNAGDVARIESYYRMQAEMMHLRGPSPVILQTYLATAPHEAP